MGTVPHPCVDIHTTPAPQPSIPPWFAESILIAGYLRGHGLLEALNTQVRFVRKRFGHYEVVDFLVLLFGYAISGERTLQAFFDRLQPFAEPFMALFERGTLPHRSTLSRFLAAIDSSMSGGLAESVCTSSFVWGWTQETIGGLWDRAGQRYLVFDIDGTREAARQRKLPVGPELPASHRRLDALCGPGYMGRRRGEVVRTRTTVLQMHTRQWLGSFAGRGNGNYRGELRQRCGSDELSCGLGIASMVWHCARGWAIWRWLGDCGYRGQWRAHRRTQAGLSLVGPSAGAGGACPRAGGDLHDTGKPGHL